ncbi:hypothetical protein RJT34_13912 [Clitoria ternatea]|uniref:GED domain-containing protein n=1 Tax=Clitoria ternatea TaxID=43366 RepID=A0AAN9JS08_CLITE
MRIIWLAKESLRKILVRGEFDEYPNDNNMHCTARLVDMLDQYSNDLHKCPGSDSSNNFLMEEFKVLEEAKWIGLPNLMPRTAFLTLLQNKVKQISSMPIEFIDNVWDYLEDVVVVEIKKLTDYTCNPEYLSEYNKLMANQNEFIKNVLADEYKPLVELEGFGNVDVRHLWHHRTLLSQAFDLKMRLTAYWRIVLRRLIDSTALHLQFSNFSLVDKDLEDEIVKDMMSPNGGGIEKVLEEASSVAMKRDNLNKSIEVLRGSDNVEKKKHAKAASTESPCQYISLRSMSAPIAHHCLLIISEEKKKMKWS